MEFTLRFQYRGQVHRVSGAMAHHGKTYFWTNELASVLDLGMKWAETVACCQLGDIYPDCIELERKQWVIDYRALLLVLKDYPRLKIVFCNGHVRYVDSGSSKKTQLEACTILEGTAFGQWIVEKRYKVLKTDPWLVAMGLGL